MKALHFLFKTDNSLSTLILRVMLGTIFFPHGAQKALGWFGGYGFEGTMGFFTGTMHIPTVFALLAITAEFAGSIGLILGCCTRIAAFGIASVMIVAAQVHAPNGFFMNWMGNQKGEGIEYSLLALTIAVALILLGGGPLSVDRAISKSLPAAN